MANQSSLKSWTIKTFRSPIHVPFTISRQSLPYAEIVLIELRDEDGHIGLGECSPFPSLTGDTVKTAEKAAKQLCESVKNKTPLEAIAHLHRLRPEFERLSITALAGVEIALWDLHARTLAVPLASLCGTADLIGVHTDITLPIMQSEDVGGFWKIFGHYGFKIIKIKVSGNPNADLDMIMAFTEMIRAEEITSGVSDLTYTLDGNQAFSESQALLLLDKLRDQGIIPACFEQPLPADDWTGLKKLSDATSVPVCLDETVKTIADCKRAIAERTARMINLKIMKSGFSQCLEIARLAKEAGLQLMIGGMLESEVAMSASLHLACGHGGILQYDLDTPFFFADHPTPVSPWHHKHAELERMSVATPGIGLGLELNLSIKD